MKRGLAWCAAFSLLAGACNNGVQTLGFEGAGAPQPLPWFGGPDYYARWPHGFPSDPSFFPLGVWMQNPLNVERFQAVGVNHYVGLWKGPTEEQLSAVVAGGMPVVCEQAGVWQQNLESTTIQGWLQADGPDNAQETPDGYAPCIEPTATQARYAEMTAADATRPVTLLLGQGVATPDWVGRGDCTGRTEDYPLYAQGADVLVNYTYPLTNGNPLELVATGIVNLNAYANYQKPIMADLEASSINGDVRATPHQLRAEVWQSLIHGAAGITYFCHRTTPLEAFNETDCLDDAATAASMTRINQELLALAPALNSQSYSLTGRISSENAAVHAVLKRVGRERYLFAAGMANSATTASFSLIGIGEPESVEVIGEGRNLTPVAGTLVDAFEPYGVHLYHYTLP